MSKEAVKIGEEGIYDAKKLGTGKVLILGFQHMFAMFGSTVLVPLLTGLSVSTTLLFAGLGTLLFHLISKKKVPAFLGSSFAFLLVMQPSHRTVSRICSAMPASVLRVPVSFTSYWPQPSVLSVPRRS